MPDFVQLLGKKLFLGFTLGNFFFQLINFAIVVFLLRQFLFKPLLKVLRERQERIQTGLTLSASADEMVTEAEHQRDAILEEARNEAERLKVEADASAGTSRREVIAKAEENAKEIVRKARESMKVESAKMIEEMQGQLVDLVAAATRKVLGEALTEDELHALVQRAVLSSLERFEDAAVAK